MEYAERKKGQRWRVAPMPGKIITAFDFTLGNQHMSGDWVILNTTSKHHYLYAYNSWWDLTPYHGHVMILLCAEAH